MGLIRKKDLFLLIYAMLMVLAAVVINTLLVPMYKTHERYTTVITNNIQTELQVIENGVVAINNNVSGGKPLDFSNLNIPLRYPYYLYQNGKLIFWSTNRFVPEYNEINSDNSLNFLTLNSGQYLVRKHVFEQNKDLELYFLLPLYNDYAINNQYIEPNVNTRIFANSNVSILPNSTEGAYQINVDGQDLFSIAYTSGYMIKLGPMQVTSLCLILLAIILYLIFLVRVVKRFVNLKKEQTGFWILLGGFILLRGIMLMTDFPFSLIAMKLFNPIHYASSNINPSPGDLLINIVVVMILALYIFMYYTRFKLYHRLINAGDNIKDVASIILVTITFFILTYIFYLWTALNRHSQWTLDINEDLDFPGLKISSYFILFVAAVIYFLMSHVIFKIYIRINKRSRYYRIFDFIIGTLVFITFSLAVDANFIVVGIVNSIYFITLYLTGFPDYLSKVQYKTFFYFFFTAFSIAIIGAYVIYTFNQRNDLSMRQKLADELLIENDYLGEYLLDEAVRKIKNDAFIRGRMLTPFLSKDIIGQKIKEVHLTQYFDRYDVKVYLFGSNGEPLSGAPSAGYRTIKSEFQEYKTQFENIYFRSTMGTRALKRYLVFIELERYGNERYNIGHIIIELNMKRIIPNSVYPELMMDKNYMQSGVSDSRFKDYNYAIILNNQIEHTSRGFNYARFFNKSFLENEEIFTKGYSIDGYRHFAKSDAETGRTIIVTSESYPFLHVISNFSFLFLVLIFFTLIILMIYAGYLTINRVKLNYAAKIQLYTNFAFFIPLLAVSITTLSVLINSYLREVERDYLSKAENISEELVEPLYEYLNNPTDREELAGRIVQVANYSNVDINLYSKSGRLLATNQPSIYDKDILSEYIHPKAIEEIIEKHDNTVILDETVGKLSYKATYVAAKYHLSGEMMGILSVPFFDSKLELEQQVIVVFTRIINIFTIVLISSLIVSYFASKWLTFPLKLITQKLRRTTLSEYNAPLTWHSNDEIGLMVSEYNRMLENLEESKKALSKSEKESAWREMAKQVAHEIKNPLTPMKLTLQHLRRMLEKEIPNNTLLVEKPINSLLHHVDTLSDIAESFSTFAQMPTPVNEKFEIASLLRQTISLYVNQEGGEIDTDIEEGEFYVMGDAQWMGRIFSNLIINGFQAVPENRDSLLKISLKNTGSKILLEFKDNGTGIPENIREKIFVPNFSTKFSGSGIGLAVAKRGVEHAGGKIWFETIENMGTSFFIELPLENKG